MAKVKRSTPASQAPAATVTVTATAPTAKAKRSASAGAVTTAAKSPAAAKAAAPPVVIEISSSPEPSVGVGSKGSNGTKKARKRPAPPPSFHLDDEIEMWTPRQKRRLDEDCQILSADPLSAITEVAPTAAANDDIAVVAERGMVACRDYPHPRSACAKNPFSTTPHERHCDKCFCYVCDIAAPCSFWKGGHEGHCHASDKDKKWKTLRFSMHKAAQVKRS